MRERLDALGACANGQPRPGPETVARLSALHARAGGDRRSLDALEEEGRRELAGLQSRGWDLGITDAGRAHARVDALYEHARAALYAALDDAVIRDATERPLVVHTVASSRDEYLAWMSYAFDQRDADHDGVLQGEELPGRRGKPITRAAHRATLIERFARQDANGDGFLSARELLAPPR